MADRTRNQFCRIWILGALDWRGPCCGQIRTDSFVSTTILQQNCCGNKRICSNPPAAEADTRGGGNSSSGPPHPGSGCQTKINFYIRTSARVRLSHSALAPMSLCVNNNMTPQHFILGTENGGPGHHPTCRAVCRQRADRPVCDTGQKRDTPNTCPK